MPFISNQYLRFIFWAVVLCFLTIYLGYFVARSDFWFLATGYGIFFLIYFAFIRAHASGRVGWLRDKNTAQYLLYLGVFLRFALVFSIPNLSDDVYRFVWDGRLSVGGVHPFAYTPQAIMDQGLQIRGIHDDLFQLLNSKQFYTVYPPICQAIFALSAWVSPQSIFGSIVVIKLFLLACEIGTIWLLHKGVPRMGAAIWPSAGVLYALNPLAIVEITGNCHFEGAMICFMIGGLLALERQKVGGAAIFWSVATASKLLPILFVPILWAYLGFKNFFKFCLIYGFSMLLFFAPLFQRTVLENMGKSINLYFKKFEYNASIYYLARYVGFRQTGYNKGALIGPWLAQIVVVGVFGLAIWFWVLYRDQARSHHHPDQKFKGLVTALLLASMLHLLCSTTVHPWYVLVPFALSLLGHPRWFPICWTGLVILSYSHYMGGHALENYGLIILEYVLLGWCLIQTYRSNHRLNPGAFSRLMS